MAEHVKVTLSITYEFERQEGCDYFDTAEEAIDDAYEAMQAADPDEWDISVEVDGVPVTERDPAWVLGWDKGEEPQ